MQIDILTLFPEMFKGPFGESIIKRAISKHLIKIKIHNLRKWTKDQHRTVDDEPYGGGVGMLLKPEPILTAVSELKGKYVKEAGKKIGLSHSILLTPDGTTFNYRIAHKLSALSHLILICGRYEGIDERVHEAVDERISIGDYILSGGEIPAMVVTEGIIRLVEGVLGKEASHENESFSYLGKLLKYPQYTRPENFVGHKVPEILLSGDHKKIEDWRKKQAYERTKKYRPDLLGNLQDKDFE